MAQGEGFKHITVTAADDEDVVIVAGAVGEELRADDVAAAADQPRESEPVEHVAEPDEPEPAKPDESADSAKLQEAAVKARASKPAKQQKDEYHETTLEDLESGPMPFAQRVVIIAAVVCIIGALIYYFAFMR